MSTASSGSEDTNIFTSTLEVIRTSSGRRRKARATIRAEAKARIEAQRSGAKIEKVKTMKRANAKRNQKLFISSNLKFEVTDILY